MGLLPTFYAHWRLNRMLRVWRKSRKLVKAMLAYSASHAPDNMKVAFHSAVKNLDDIMAEIEESVESDIISELKERI
jgi:hypothetical protein